MIAAATPRFFGLLTGLLLLGGMACPTFGQVDKLIPQVTPPSPNVASLGRYGEYPVNLFTGLPSISIPLYEVKSGGLTLPITLSYHAAGVRCTDQASWVGLGWSLNTGGLLSRKVMGSFHDESSSGYLSRTNVTNFDPCLHWEEADLLARNAIDGEPDVFSYSLLGKNGKFTLSQSGQPPHLVPFAPIKITPSLPGLGQFEITDEDGTYYRFGMDAEGTSHTEFSSTSGSNPTAATTAWMLTQIAAPNSDDQIRFTYQSGGQAIMSDYTSYTTVIDLIADSQGDEFSAPPENNGRDAAVASYTTSVVQKNPQFIYFENGMVEFVQSSDFRRDQTQQRSLDRIIVYNRQGGSYIPQRTIQFVYSYFKVLGQDHLLKLDEVQVKDRAGVIQQRYGLQYFTNQFSWNVDPRLYPGIRARDAWGYYNGKTTNTNLLPTQTINYQPNANSAGTGANITVGGADRSTVTGFMKEGVLQRITFPTRGYTEFDFETNRYQKDDNSLAYAGGLRVTKIASYDYSGAVLSTKTYKYGLNESGYGSRNFNPSFAFYQTTQNFSYRGAGGNSTDYRIRHFFSSPTLDLDPYDGSPVVYPYVTEYHGDATSNIGKTSYVYDNGSPPGDVARVLPGSGKLYKESVHWRRGFLTAKTIFDKGGRLLSKTIHQHQLYRQSQPYRGEMAVTRIILSGNYPQRACPTPNARYDADQYAVANYAIPSGVNKLVYTMEYQYDQNSADTTRNTKHYTAYAYTNTTHLQVNEIRQSASGSGGTLEEVVTQMKYPTDYGVIPATATSNARGLRMLSQQNALSTVVEKRTLRRTYGGTNARIVSGMLTTYQENPNNTTQTLPDAVYLLETAAPITSTAIGYSSVSGNEIVKDNRYQPRLYYHSYDEKGNPTEFSKAADPARTVVLWGYGGQLPVAEVRNARFSSQLVETPASPPHSVGNMVMNAVLTPTNLSPLLVLDHAQTVSIQCIRVIGSVSHSVNITLKDEAGNTRFNATYPSGTSNATAQSVSLSAGRYTFSYTTSNFSDTNNGRFDLATTYTINVPRQNVFHTSFEENGTDDAAAKTGRRSHLGNYTIPAPPDGQYVLSYWQKTGANGGWTYVEQTVTAVGSAGGIAVGNGNYFIDEVRLYPAGARMITYTYDPQIGATSVTDPANVTLYHVYDGLGRLQHVKDLNGNIVKQHVYHHKGQ